MKYLKILKVRGRIKGTSYYTLNGKYVQRKTYQVSKERMMTDDAYRPQRQNMSEFGASSMIGKLLRNTLMPQLDGYRDRQISGRFNAAIRQVMSAGDGEKGKLPFEFSKHGNLLEGFSFRKGKQLKDLVDAKIHIESNATRTSFSLHLEGLKPALIRSPRSATHVEFVGFGCVLSDYFYDGT